MTKHMGKVIVSVLIFVLLFSGCKMPASEAPITPSDQIMTTPIRLQTDTPGALTESPVDKPLPTATLESGEEVPSAPTNTPEPTIVIAVPTVTRPAKYTLKDGEFLYCIARRFDLNVADLISLNNLGNTVSPGTTIQIPQDSSWPDGSRALLSHPTTHTVSAGETIYSIACTYGDVSPEAIIAVNQLEEPYELSPGQVLNIP